MIEFEDWVEEFVDVVDLIGIDIILGWVVISWGGGLFVNEILIVEGDKKMYILFILRSW